MWRLRSRFPEIACALASLLAPAIARAQACCAGSSVVTPGRLALHEQALVGAQLRAGYAFGFFDPHGHYASNPAGASELDLEQDVFGAVRVLRRGQVALLVPFIETRRQTRSAGSEFGGGLGDVNVSARWDFVGAGEHVVVPGIGLLAGVTFPTGKAPEDSSKRLATDATGVGAFQGNVGLALEQSWGPWLANVTGIVSVRGPRTVENVRSVLGAQITTIAAVAYSLPDERALAVLASYVLEDDATVDGMTVPNSGRRVLRLSVAGAYPLSDAWRLRGSLYLDPPIVHVGQNQPTAAGLTFAVTRSWT